MFAKLSVTKQKLTNQCVDFVLIFVVFLGESDYESLSSKGSNTILKLSKFAADRISPKNFH